MHCTPSGTPPRDLPALPRLDNTKPTFTEKDGIMVVFVLGGPGAGKGTQCNMLADELDMLHLSAGDLLRAERNRPGSPYGDLINNCITEGRIVPMQITISLLRKAMIESGRTRFLIDGFPRAIDQGEAFEQAVCPASAVIFLDCPEEVLLKRLLERGKTSGRSDDNAESIHKRFQVFIETSKPVVDHYRAKGTPVFIVDSSGPARSVCDSAKKVLSSLVINGRILY